MAKPQKSLFLKYKMLNEGKTLEEPESEHKSEQKKDRPHRNKFRKDRPDKNRPAHKHGGPRPEGGIRPAQGQGGRSAAPKSRGIEPVQSDERFKKKNKKGNRFGKKFGASTDTRSDRSFEVVSPGQRSQSRPQPQDSPRPQSQKNAGPYRQRHQKKSRDHNLVTVQGEIQKNAKGFAFLLNRPEDIFIPPQHAEKLVTGDVVKAWVNPRNLELSHLEIVKRNLKQFIGTYDAGFGTRIVMLEDKGSSEEVIIREAPQIEGLRSRDKVLVEITKYQPKLEGKILRTFGPKLAPKFDTLAVVARSGWPQEFSAKAVEEAEDLSKRIQKEAETSAYTGRKDLREKPFVTIDGATARDFDDAILVEKTAAGFVLYVAIADVSEFVLPGTKLDEEAYGRATSVYFPEWVIPMLPEALSNGACSLRPNEDKLTLTCEMHFDPEGKKRSAKMYESVIRSARRCIYEEVEKEYAAGEEFWKEPYNLFRKIRSRRFKRGALDLDLPEAKIVLNEHGDTIDIVKEERVDAHKVIEEFMIAANEAVTEIMERERWPFVYRVHEPPKTESLDRFETFAHALGLKPNFGEGDDPVTISRFIDSIKDKPYAQTLNYLLLRSLKQARYEPTNLFHFGLASRAYTHFTSPIRRYPDLMVHRLIKKFVRHQKFSPVERSEFETYLVESTDHCSKQERKAEDLDRKVTRIKKARFMEKHLGETFTARITNVTEKGVYVELEKWFIDGQVPIDELGDDYYQYIESKLMIKGKRSGKKYNIGDEIDVMLLRVDIDNGLIDFTLDDGRENQNANHKNRKASYPSR